MTTKKTAGKAPSLLRWEISYLKRAARLRKKLTNAALAERFGVSKTTVTNYLSNGQLHGCREDYYADVERRRKRRQGSEAAA